MDPRDEMFINRYRYSEDKFIETIRQRHEMFTDAWLCSFKDNTKQFITSFNHKEFGWMDKVQRMAVEHIVR